MSAVPQKKLCWNCEGNVSKDIDNCPYCAVYLHADELEENSSWSSSYRSSSKAEEIPSPLYQIKPNDEQDFQEENENESVIPDDTLLFTWNALFKQLKCDIFPILFLMMGSTFFIFGVVLFLFSENGTFTLQWQERDSLYFLLFAVPLLGLGWMFLQQMESND